MSDDLKTSQDWLTAVQAETGDTITIADPDGWDRKNYEYSFNEELISRQEFDVRLSHSTVLMRAARQNSAA